MTLCCVETDTQNVCSKLSTEICLMCRVVAGAGGLGFRV